MTLGQRIQELRKQHNLSQEALGEKLGVSRQAISRWEMDGAVPEVDKLMAMARLFHLTVGQLLGEEALAAAPAAAPEAPPRRGRRPRPLTVLCAVLALVAVVSSGLAFSFYRRLDSLLNPPLLPVAPVSQVEYDYAADYDTGTFQLAMELTSDALDGWEVVATLSAYDLEQGRPVPVAEEELLFREDSAALRFADIPFEPYHDIYIHISYSRDLLEGQQELLIIHPKGKTRPMWEIELPRSSTPSVGLPRLNDPPDYQAVEDPSLLEGTEGRPG